MTLNDYTNLICSKIGQTDASSVAACQTFVAARYKIVYDMALWKDTLLLASAPNFPFSPVIQAPQPIERILKIFDSNNLQVPNLSIAAAIDADPSLLTTGSATVGFYHLPDAVAFNQGNPAPVLPASWSDQRDTSFEISISGLNGAGAIVSETLPQGNVPTAQAASQNSYKWLYSYAKPVTFGDVSVTSTWGINLLPSQTEAPVSAFAQLVVPTFPQSGGQNTYTLLGKRRFAPLVSPTDAPIIRGIENALIALGSADMLERNRQYAKAQAKVAEADQNIKVTLDLEKNQTAWTAQIIPADIHGEATIGGFSDKTHW